MFIYPKDVEKHWSCFRGSITMSVQFILVGLYIILLDPEPLFMSWTKAFMVAYLLISFFFIKENKWE